MKFGVFLPNGSEGYLLTKGDMVWFWDHYLENDKAGNAPYASPLLAKYINSPPQGLFLIEVKYEDL